jgi:hypothetical protein
MTVDFSFVMGEITGGVFALASVLFFTWWYTRGGI